MGTNALCKRALGNQFQRDLAGEIFGFEVLVSALEGLEQEWAWRKSNIPSGIRSYDLAQFVCVQKLPYHRG